MNICQLHPFQRRKKTIANLQMGLSVFCVEKPESYAASRHLYNTGGRRTDRQNEKCVKTNKKMQFRQQIFIGAFLASYA